MTGMILVAAGYGSLRSIDGLPVPKVLELVRGLPMLLHPLRLAERVGIQHTVVVVNPLYADDIHRAITEAVASGVLRSMPQLAQQRHRHGAADAVRVGIPFLRALGERTALIAYGDMPNWSLQTVRMLLSCAMFSPIATMVTVERSDVYPILDGYGRVVRDAHRRIQRIIEVNDPNITDEIRAIRHVNPSLWVWNLRWLEQAIPHIAPYKKADGYGDERYMPPLVEMATAAGHRIMEYIVSAECGYEACGVNTMAQLEAINRRVIA